MEGASNAVSRNIGMAIAEQPNSYRFNPMFVFGPSGSGKTHLINAMGVRMKERYPNKNIRYVSARLFQQEFTTASLQNKINDFIYFYQKMDMLIIDDIQEWMNSEKTQMTFFHIFNHLDLNGRRIILACDRPPVELQGMHERLLTRFRGGFIAPLEKPDAKLCTDILNRWIKREGLAIPADVVEFIAQHANGSVRDLQGVLNSLLLLSINTNCDIDLSMAERVMGYTVKTFDASIAIGDIVEEVCAHYHVQQSKVMSASRKKELVLARQVAMYLARQLTKMPDTKIGKAIANRDHSTVIHSCAQVEQRIAADKTFRAEINALLNACRARG